MTRRKVKAKAEAPKKRVKKAEDSADDADAKAKKVVKKKTVAKADDAKAKPAKKTVAKKTTAKKTADSAESKTATKAKSTRKKQGVNMAVTAKDIQIIRQRTNAPLLKCKETLMKADGDHDKALDILREMGAASAVKKGDRMATEGVVKVYQADQKLLF